MDGELGQEWYVVFCVDHEPKPVTSEESEDASIRQGLKL